MPVAAASKQPSSLNLPAAQANDLANSTLPVFRIQTKPIITLRRQQQKAAANSSRTSIQNRTPNKFCPARIAVWKVFKASQTDIHSNAGNTANTAARRPLKQREQPTRQTCSIPAWQCLVLLSSLHVGVGSHQSAAKICKVPLDMQTAHAITVSSLEEKGICWLVTILGGFVQKSPHTCCRTAAHQSHHAKSA
jgi:hypothetical protein